MRVAFGTRLQRLIIITAMALALIIPGSGAAFDSARAMRDIETQVAFGPRVPGTPSHEACRKWIKAQIHDLGFQVVEDPFEAKLAVTFKKNVPAVNIWGLPLPAAEMTRSKSKIILISAHWDSRPYADKDPREKPPVAVPGANDGASGVAMALELARDFKRLGMGDRIALAFWDAEDAGLEMSRASYCLGSQRAAANPPEWFNRMALGINLDMVASPGLRLRPETNSLMKAPDAVRRLWDIGMELNPQRFDRTPLGPVYDDHVPFLEKGYKYIDLIGFPYAYWHTSEDTPDKCDPAVMRAIADTVLEFVRRELRLMDGS